MQYVNIIVNKFFCYTKYIVEVYIATHECHISALTHSSAFILRKIVFFIIIVVVVVVVVVFFYKRSSSSSSSISSSIY